MLLKPQGSRRTHGQNNSGWLLERAILAPLNETVNSINNTLTKAFWVTPSYMSASTKHSPTKKLPTTQWISMPSLSPPKTTNGTCCIISKLNTDVIHATISTGPYKGEDVLIPRILLIPSDTSLPFQSRHLQFPVQTGFAMTINKSQGQTFSEVGF